MKNKYEIIAICGKSGSGKNTILEEVLKQAPQLHKIIPSTTRPKREKEVDGEDYYFLPKELFIDKIINSEFAEVTNFNDWCYGTSYDSLRTGIYNIGIFNPESICSLLENSEFILYLYYIDCSDKIRLLRQLNREQEPNVEEIVRRYNTDKYDFLDLNLNNCVILKNENEEDLECAVRRILSNLD